MQVLELSVVAGDFSIHRFGSDRPVPEAVLASDWWWLARTPHELSVVCRSSVPVTGERTDAGWACLAVAGPLDLATTGVLAAIATTLASVGINIFALSTYDTDYVLVPAGRLDAAVSSLRAAGHAVHAGR